MGREGLTQVADDGGAEPIIDQVMAANPKAIADFKTRQDGRRQGAWWGRS